MYCPAIAELLQGSTVTLMGDQSALRKGDHLRRGNASDFYYILLVLGSSCVDVVMDGYVRRMA